jgi:tetratricopeptide (TPR) repeat protein
MDSITSSLLQRCSIRDRDTHPRCNLLLVFSLFLFPLTSWAQQEPKNDLSSNSLTGVVLSEKGNTRIQGVLVQLCKVDGTILEERRTQDTGEFSFGGLAPGRYVLQLSAEGYEPTAYDPGIRLGGGQTLTLYMKAIEKSVDSGSGPPSMSAHLLSIPPKARDLYQSGMKKLYGDKNAQEALVDFDKAVGRAPGFYEAEFQSGMALLKLGKGEEAESRIRKSMEMSGDRFAGANVALGLILFDRGDLKGAEEQFLHALEFNPSAWMACYKLGEIAYRRDDLSQAEALATKAKHMQGAGPMVDQLLAEVHIKQKNYTEAIRDIDAYLALDPVSENANRLKELKEKLKGLEKQ